MAYASERRRAASRIDNGEGLLLLIRVGIVLLLAMAGVMIYLLVSSFMGGRGDISYDQDIGAKVLSAAENNEENVDNVLLKVDFPELKKQNKDTVGWISLPETIINYPVLQTDNNTKYLNTRFDGAASEYGSIFADHRSKIYSGKNIILYGHNQSDINPIKFTMLHNYLTNPDFFGQHPFFEFYKAEGGLGRKYMVFSAFVADTTDKAFVRKVYRNVPDEEYPDYLKYLKSLSAFDTGVTPSPDRQSIILSTCSNVQDKERILVCLIEARDAPRAEESTMPDAA